jgi:hypothetical protein
MAKSDCIFCAMLAPPSACPSVMAINIPMKMTPTSKIVLMGFRIDPQTSKWF